MSDIHPVIAVTGSSGAGTSTVKTAFEHIFHRERVTPCIIEGDSFHRYDRAEMHKQVEKALAEGRPLSHFGPESNHFDKIERLFRDYSETGTGKRRYYVHNEEEAARLGRPPGTFTPWESIQEGTDLLFYEGLHGAVANGRVNVARYPDLLIGVVPIVNLEWIQKIHRDTADRGYDARQSPKTFCAECTTTCTTSRRSSRSPTSTSSGCPRSIRRIRSSRATFLPPTRVSS